MKNIYFFTMVALIAVLPFTLVSCNDDDDTSSSMDTIEINGVSYPVYTDIVTMSGSWNEWGSNKGSFTLSVGDKRNGDINILYYTFNFISDSTLSVGDVVSSMSLTLEPLDGGEGEDDYIWYGEFEYASGTATVVSVNQSKNRIVVEFDNLVMQSRKTSYTYTFNGSASIDFEY